MRIIPTRVGTRSVLFFALFNGEDHPHACGDKITSKNELSSKRGSSPRVWGQVQTNGVFYPNFRIIPTRVGTRKQKNTISQVVRDHPHACGDKKYNHDVGNGRGGSSPRVWGQGTAKNKKELLERIIPTRVGTRKVAVYCVECLQDHPHACGDKR